MNSGNVRIWRRSLWWALFKSNWARFSCHYGWLALGVVRPTTILSVDVAIFGLCDSGGVLSSKTVLCRTNCARLRFGDEWWMVGRCARGHILCFYNVWSFFFSTTNWEVKRQTIVFFCCCWPSHLHGDIVFKLDCEAENETSQKELKSMYNIWKLLKASFCAFCPGFLFKLML